MLHLKPARWHGDSEDSGAALNGTLYMLLHKLFASSERNVLELMNCIFYLRAEEKPANNVLCAFNMNINYVILHSMTEYTDTSNGLTLHATRLRVFSLMSVKEYDLPCSDFL